MCVGYRYWPAEGMEAFGAFEVHLVSEHIVCDDYLVRNFYLKNVVTNETRTITQFHFLTWTEYTVPAIRSLIEFRRYVPGAHIFSAPGYRYRVSVYLTYICISVIIKCWML